MTDAPPHPRPRVIRANHLLQAKVGSGEIDAARIQAVQKKMDSLSYDFTPLAREFMEDIQRAVIAAEKSDGPSESLREALIAPVMQMKANAPMFGYSLIGELAHIVLTLLETAPQIDADVIEIVGAQHKTIDIILKNGMTGSGGDYGAQLQDELQRACNRYYSRHNLRPVVAGTNDGLIGSI
jgi:chemotaxis protein histidine kinase CheA